MNRHKEKHAGSTLRLVIAGVCTAVWTFVVVYATTVNAMAIGLAQTITPVMIAIIAGFSAREYLDRKKNGYGDVDETGKVSDE